MFLLPLVIALVPVVGGKARFYNIGAYLHQIIPEVLLLLRRLIGPALLVVPPVLRVGHSPLMLRRLEAVLSLQRTQQPREAVLLQLVHGQGLVPQPGQPAVHVRHGLLVALLGHAVCVAGAVPAAQRGSARSGVLSRCPGIRLRARAVLPVELAVRAYVIARIAGRAHAVQCLVDPVGVVALVRPRHRVLRVLLRRLRVLVSLEYAHL